MDNVMDGVVEQIGILMSDIMQSISDIDSWTFSLAFPVVWLWLALMMISTVFG